LECGEPTRYCTYDFKDYCKKHSSIAESRGGTKGGKAQAWNKGKTINTDSRIEKSTFPGKLNPFYGKKHTDAAKKSNADKHRLSLEEFSNRVNSKPDRFICLSSYNDYKYRQGQKLLFKCQTCDDVIEHTLLNFERNPICKTCHPGGSVAQLEIADFIKTLGITDLIYNDREAIGPKELDIYIPSRKVAIEYDSFYYHSYSEKDTRKDRHYAKTVACEALNINLIHIFEDEWRDKQAIVKSMIAYRLGTTKRRVYARKCSVREISTQEARRFFDSTHVAGYTRAGIVNLGLYEKDELVSAISFRKPFHTSKYKGSAEVARFASLLDTCVVGGLQKLLKRGRLICRSKGYKSIVTYADLRYGQGLGYKKAGFEDIGWTGLSYDYNDGSKRYSRFKFRAKDGMTEQAVAGVAGVNKIYGCGSKKYMMQICE